MTSNPAPITVPPAEPPSIVVGGIFISASAVELIVGESGVNLNGEEMLIWKRTVVVASGRRHVFRAGPEENEQFFAATSAACPQALAIRPDGSITLPRIAPEGAGDPLQILEDALTTVKRVFGGQALRSFLWGMGFLAAGAAVLAAVVSYNEQHPQAMAGFKIAMWGIVLVVVAFLLGGRAIWLLGRRRRVIRAVRGLLGSEGLDAAALAAALAPPAEAHCPKVGLVAGTVAILALIMIPCPFVNLAVAVVSAIVSRHSSGWDRTLVYLSLVFSVIVSAVTGVMIALMRM